MSAVVLYFHVSLFKTSLSILEYSVYFGMGLILDYALS